MKQSLIIVLVALVLLVGGGLFLIQGGEGPGKVSKDITKPLVVAGEEHTVTLIEGGYMPEEITIKKGDTVTWQTDAGGLFWPASNLHPAHRDYPGGVFDPKRPIEPDATWSFTFNEAGDWKYHDHLAPYNTGIIHVVE